MPDEETVEDLAGILEVVGVQFEVKMGGGALHPSAPDGADLRASLDGLTVDHVHPREVHVARSGIREIARSAMANADIASARAERRARDRLVLGGRPELLVSLMSREVDAREDHDTVGHRAHGLVRE